MVKGITSFGAIVSAAVLGFGAHAEAKRYLVQFKSPAAFYSASQAVAFNSGLDTNSVSGQQAMLLGSSARVTKTLNGIHMMIVESDDALAIAALRSRPGIARVELEIFHPAPAPIATRSRVADTSSVVSLRRNADVADMPWGISAVKAPEAWATTKGSGARVMVLDTGVDQGHPAVHANIEAVQNFTGGDSTDVTDSVGHGTHVSGTILADGNNGLIGVAPEAKLLMGKVCTDLGCSSVSIADGLNWAVQQKVDVVNMSLGGAYTTDGETQAMQEAEAGGVTVVAASGNDGKPTVSFPAALPTGFAVGAIDSTNTKATFSNWGPELAVVAPGVDVYSSVPRGTGRGATVQLDLGGGKGLNDIKSAPFVGSPVAGAAQNTLVFCGLGDTPDFANVNVKGKFALIQRGTIPFKAKVDNAIAAGAVGVIIFNNAAGLLNGTITSDGTEEAIPAVMIEQSIGQAAQQALAAGTTVSASLAVIKTDFAVFEGTSMATPHVTGVAALVKAANHSLTPAQVRDILKSTATALGPNDQNQYGSGLVNAEAAVAKAKATFVPVFNAAN